MFNSRRSLKLKLLLPILLFVGAIFVFSQVMTYQTTFEREKENLIERVKVLANGVAYNLEAAIVFDDSIAASEILSAFSADDEVQRVKLFTSDNQLFASYVDKTSGDVPIPDELQRKEIIENQFSVAEDHIFLVVPVQVEGAYVAHLRVTISKSYFDLLLTNTVKSSVGFFAILLVAGFILFWIVDRAVIGPILGLNEAMQSFIERKSSLSSRSLYVSNDEMGELVRCFNTMIDQLKQREVQVSYTLDKLEEEKAFATEVIEMVQHALVVIDEAGKVVLTNIASNQVFRCSGDYLRGQALSEVLKDFEEPMLTRALQGEMQLDDLLFISKGMGEEQILQISSRKLSKSGMVLFAIQDVTELEQSFRRQKLAAGVFENSQDGLMVLNHDHNITMVNPAMTAILGFRPTEMVDKKPQQVFDWKQFSGSMDTIMDAVRNYGQWQGELSELHKNGRQVPLFVKVNKINENFEDGHFDMVMMFSDLTDVKEVERLEYLAHHDSLTGLANRAQVYRTLEETIRVHQGREGEYAVVYLDLDGFKAVNDTYGHDAGDEVLKTVATRLNGQVRNTDLVGRLAGDEFVVLLTPSNNEGASIICQRILDNVSVPIQYKNHSLEVGVSLGVYVGSGKDGDVNVMLKAADTAMYHAKTNGKGNFVIFNQLEQSQMIEKV